MATGLMPVVWSVAGGAMVLGGGA
ncbi:MAG: hypothetical protein RIT14_2447, partial [Pseudomonadota bacterium]